MTPLLPAPDTADFFACTWTMFDEHNRPYFCGRRCVAVYDVEPLGRLPRCKVHQKGLLRAGYAAVVQL